ncbi:MAG: hypothetical protein V3S30_02120 [Thermoanaerobaculia bacterium]
MPRGAALTVSDNYTRIGLDHLGHIPWFRVTAVSILATANEFLKDASAVV